MTAVLLLVCNGSYSVETSAKSSPSSDDDNTMNAFGRMVPLGFVNRNVRIPSFSKGKPASVMTADTVTRIDAENLETGKATVEILAENQQENILVNISTGLFNMPEQILRSGERTMVSRHDFQMEGDSMVFDSRTAIGNMKGHVRTVIFDLDTMSGAPKAAGNNTK